VHLRAPRLIATDLDGTLLRSDGVLSDRTRDALRAVEEAGIGVVFVTARPPRWVDALRADVGGHGAAICANGSAVYDVRERRVLLDRGMTPELVSELVEDLRRSVAGASFAVESIRGLAAEPAFGADEAPPWDAAPARDVTRTLEGSTFKLLVRSTRLGPVELLDNVHASLAERAIVADSGASGLAEITGPGVTKASTLAHWAAGHGVEPADVWAFGDAPNDLPMLAWAGESFAVANAYPAVRAAASWTCAANDDDGVAQQLEAALEALARHG